jgi:hypothetical protein
MRWLLRRRHAARQALQVTLHSGRRPLKLLEVFFGQTIKSECAGLVTEFLGHRPLAAGRFRTAACTLFSFLQTKLNPQSPSPAMMELCRRLGDEVDQAAW